MKNRTSKDNTIVRKKVQTRRFNADIMKLILKLRELKKPELKLKDYRMPLKSLWQIQMLWLKKWILL